MRSPRIATGAITTLDKLTYAGRHRDAARRDGSPAPRASCAATSATAPSSAPLVERAGHRRPLRGRDARRPVDSGGRRLHPHRRDRHVRAARGGARGAAPPAVRADLDRRGLRQRAEGASRETDELRPRNPYSASKAARRPARLQLLRDLRRAGRSSRARRTTTGRTSFPRSSSRSSSPTRSTAAGAALRRRQATSATGCTSTTTAARVDLLIDTGATGRGLQHRRRQRGPQRRPHPPHPRRSSAGRAPDPAGEGPPGHDRRYSLDTTKLRALGWAPAADFEHGLRADRRAGTGPTSGGGGRSRIQDPTFRAFYEAQYGTALG